MKTYNLLIYFISALFALSGCKSMYIPNMQNVPLLKNEGEVNLSMNNNNIQGAIAVSDHIGLIGNAYFNDNNWQDNDLDLNDLSYHSYRYLGEGGIGVFSNMNNIVFEIYGGGGFGRNAYNSSYLDPGFNFDPKEYSATYTKMFFQPNIGYSNNFMDIAFSTRFVNINFIDVDVFNYTITEMENEKLFYDGKSNFIFVEPAITLRFGYKWFKFHVQAIHSNKLSWQPLDYRQFQINAGININLFED